MSLPSSSADAYHGYVHASELQWIAGMFRPTSLAKMAMLLAGTWWTMAASAQSRLSQLLAAGSTPSVQAQVAPVEVVGGLRIPWSVVIVGDEALVGERNTANILAIRPGHAPRLAGTIPGVSARIDGGLLGLATLRRGDSVWIYAFHSTVSDNRIVRASYENGTLGRPELVFSGLPGGGRGHDGGRIAFGPDGMLYIAVGEIRNAALSQDLHSLGGKILRITPEGRVPNDNPFKDSPVYSFGHRNPQGLAWDGKGQLWATEFGDKGWDELNRIEPGRNYGWPQVEGQAGNPAFVDPVVQWRTSEMGPSGLAYIDGTFFIAGLTGRRLWTVTLGDAGHPTARAHYVGTYGRIRDVARGPDGSLWFVTNNTDGRGGTPPPGGDRILSVPLEPVRDPLVW